MITSKPAAEAANAEVSPAEAAARGNARRSKRAPKATKGSAKPVTQPPSKQDRVLAMLHGKGGTTIAAVMKATGWQKHSVHGFFAGVVRKRLQLKLASEKVGDERIYRIESGTPTKASRTQSKRRRSA